MAQRDEIVSDLIERLRLAEERIRLLEAALREIAEGKGRYSLDHMQHCMNTVEDMKQMAVDALGEVPESPAAASEETR